MTGPPKDGLSAVVRHHAKDGRILLHAQTADERRDWLERNYEASDGAWLASWKQTTGKPFGSHADSVDEAQCFGCVDSRPNRLDDERAIGLSTPRNLSSPWSRINKGKVARLMGLVRTAPAGAPGGNGAGKRGMDGLRRGRGFGHSQ